jgi:hypothetical protein
MCLSLAVSIPISGQDLKDNASFNVIFKSLNNQHHFRIIPSKPHVWKYMVDSGIVIEKYEINSNAVLTPKLLTQQPLKPAPIAAWKTLLDSQPKATIVFNCLETLGNQKSNGSIASIIADQENMNNCFMLSMLSIFENKAVAAISGLAFQDSVDTVSPINVYRFYIKGISKFDTVYLRIRALNNVSIPKFPKPALQNAESKIQIKWNSDIIPENYFGIYLEKSIDSGTHFERINQVPVILGTSVNGNLSNFYTDSIGEASGKIVYRIQGLDYFGDAGPYSDTAIIQIIAANKFSAENLSFEEINNQAQLSWYFPINHQNLIANFELYFADKMTNDFELIKKNIPVSNRSINVENNGYYKIAAVDFKGIKKFSFPILVQRRDTIAPMQPAIVTATADSNQIVKIIWNKNTEPDFYGYKIFKSNFRLSEFSARTPYYFSDTSFLDSLSTTLNRDSIFYYIIAADMRFNESLPSRIIALKLADLRHPAVPVISNYKTGLNRIDLYWNNAINKIAGYTLKRSMKTKDKTIEDLLFLQQDSLHYTDTQLLENAEYSYALSSIGTNGLNSPFSAPIQIQCYGIKVLPKLSFQSIIYDSLAQKLYFYWAIPDYAGISHYRICEIEGANKLRTIAVTDAMHNSYALAVNKGYSIKKYTILVYLNDGRRSIP